MLWRRALLLASVLGSVGSVIKLKKKVVEGGVAFWKIKSLDLNATDPPPRVEGYGLDILMIADYSLYNAFVEISRGDHVSAQYYTSEYLTAIYEQIEHIYDAARFDGVPMKLSLAGIHLTLREEDCPMLSLSAEMAAEFDSSNRTIEESELAGNGTGMHLSVSGISAINRLTSWVTSYAEFLPHHDHAIMITKFDLLNSKGDSPTQGMAYVGEICKIGASSSIVEDIGAAATAVIAAHELGHSLGAVHDGSPQSKECSSADNHLMAMVASGSENDRLFSNSRVFSNCSIRQIVAHVKSETAECVRKPTTVPKKAPESAIAKKMPGEIFTVHQQCGIAFGPMYAECPNPEYKQRDVDPCRRLWCKNRSMSRFEPCETKNYLPALDGTVCGRHKWCIAGECVVNEKAMANCKNLNEKTCSRYSKSKLRHYCKSRDFQDICCLSCSKLKDFIRL